MEAIMPDEKNGAAPVNDGAEPILLTVAQAAQRYFGISSGALSKRIERGLAPPQIRIGGRVFFHRDGIEEWISGHRRSA
jgi:predicted DNA-binding transcriptional regulator AlpA